MPLEIPLPATTESFTLEEYLHAIRSENYDFTQREDLIDSARHLQKLANNKRFLLDQVFEELRTVQGFQQSNFYGPQSFMLHVCESFFLRANVWKPISPLEKSIEGFQYDVCHDHNFDILTAGYFGPGYRSRCYSYRREDIMGVPGEQVELHPDGIFQLSPGSLALYRGKLDVHIQLPPEELSISLNLIPKNSLLREMQFQFDEASGRIVRYLQISGSELAVRLAGLLGGGRFVDALESIAQGNPNANLRALARVSLAQLGAEIRGLEEEIPLVRAIVQAEGREYGASFRASVV